MGVASKIIFESGEMDGKPWIRGFVPLTSKKHVYVNTLSGEGVDEICCRLNKFISYQSTKINFPYSNFEDLKQDIYLLAVEAIPKYNISKNTNIITFLQGHIKNRLINKCKFISEKKRRATFSSKEYMKIRCPSCKKMFFSYETVIEKCVLCDAYIKDKNIKRYNTPILPVSFGAIEAKFSEEEGSYGEFISEHNSLSALLGEEKRSLDDEIMAKLDFLKIFHTLDDTNKKIVSMLIKGYPYKEIADRIGISEKATYARVAKIARHKKT